MVLEGRGANRAGVGARVRVSAGGRRMTRQVAAGSGYQSTSAKALHFGLGESAAAERVEVTWPSGRTQAVTGVAAGQVLRLAEPPGD